MSLFNFAFKSRHLLSVASKLRDINYSSKIAVFLQKKRKIELFQKYIIQFFVNKDKYIKKNIDRV